MKSDSKVGKEGREPRGNIALDRLLRVIALAYTRLISSHEVRESRVMRIVHRVRLQDSRSFKIAQASSKRTDCHCGHL
jgi:hypothetical protein